jgi:small subunit ribosomal protein S3
MGQKVHPIGFRVGVSRTWDSIWYADKENYTVWLHEDIQIRKHLKKELKEAGISQVQIARKGNDDIYITIYAAKPGMIHSAGSKDRLKKIKNSLKKVTERDVKITTTEISKQEKDAQLVAEGIANQLERRVSFRRAMKRAIQQAQRAGIGGIKVSCAGRLGGADMSRTEWFREGRVPLHTLRANVDYGFAEALTTYGITGVKVWIYQGDVD